MAGVDAQDHHPFKSPEARERYTAFYTLQAAAWPVPSEARTVHTADGETFIRTCGPDNAPPLVLLPAGRTNSTCWIPLIEAVSERFRVYALDAIYDDGLSVSSRPIKKTEDATGWLDGVFDALGLDSGINLMGISFGGWLAAEYALRSPERLARMVWVSPAGVVLPLSGQFIARSMACLVPSEAAFRWVTGWIMADAAAKKPEFFDSAVQEMALSEKCFRFRMWPGGGPRKFTDDELGGIDVPVLYVVGANERICSDPQEAVARVSAVAPKIRAEVIRGAGHDALWVETDAVRASVMSFLAT